MRRFRNNKPNYVISILSQDISEILLKCPQCYITILTQEVLKEVLNASLDVTVHQLLGTAPSVRKELIKQLAKVRRAPSDKPNCVQYKATVEDITDEDEPKKPIKKIIKEKIESGKYDRKGSSYKPVNLEDIMNKTDLKECSDSEGDESSKLEGEIDVAPLLLPRSTTILSGDGKKRVITMGDPVVQYLSSLPKGKSPKTFYMKESSLALRSIYPLVNNARQEEALLDSGSQIVSMSKEAAISLKMSWNPDISNQLKAMLNRCSA